MSPASQGALEVERYIGSCLISSGCCKQQEQPQQQHRSNTGKQFWAGGAPLMQQQQQSVPNRVPLSRLAVHTQGAPLILSSQRYHNNRQLKQPPPLFNNISRPPPPPQQQQQQQQQQPQPQRINNKLNSTPELKKTLQQQQQPAKTSEANVNGTNVASIDSLSIASDESSGSNNSENSLPRIIKPRKRRKKDRKPPLVQVNPPKTTASVDNKAPAASALAEESSAAAAAAIVVQSTLSSSSSNSQPEPPRLRSYSYDNNQRYNSSSNNSNGNNDNYYRRSSNNRPQNNSLTQPGSKLQQQEVVDTRQQQQQQRFAHRHVQVKVLDDNRNVILPVPLCQAAVVAAGKANNYLRQQNGAGSSNRFLRDFSGESLNCHSQDIGDECGALSQCRYCDPATLIWDVADQASFPAQYLAQPPMVDLNHHHRHHHHHHHHRYAQVPVFLTARPIICQEHASAIEFFDVAAAAATADNPCLRLRASTDRIDGAALLRRSWSDPTSYFSDEIVPNRDVGVIGDRGAGQSATGDSTKSKNPWRGDALSLGSSSPVDQPASPTNSSDSGGAGSPALQGPLEVSTEIVTSPNGHRDLEIKFYSSSPTVLNHRHRYTGSSPEGSKSAVAFAFPDDDDSEEFSDIWSYHESKLQQDFRTLLQAGED